MTNHKDEAPFVNPIDPDKVTDIPGLLPYAHHSGSALIKPVDKGRIKGNALAAMYEQTNAHLDQIRQQVELLMSQANAIKSRVEISEQIYIAAVNIRPIIGHTYHLYEKKDGTKTLSLIGPNEWGPRPPYTFIATVKLLSDHTWDVLS
jgi:hypothetical protein